MIRGSRIWLDQISTSYETQPDCIELCKGIEWCGVHYKPLITRITGIANPGNGLAVIKRLVFDDKELTGAQILHALKTNFEDASPKLTVVNTLY